MEHPVIDKLRRLIVPPECREGHIPKWRNQGLQEAINELETHKCEWSYNPHFSSFETSCGHEFYFEDYDEEDFKIYPFCPRCAGLIVIGD